MKERKDFKLVAIGWADAMSNESGWKTYDEAVEWVEDDDFVTHQVGWIIKETKEYILMADKFNEPSGGRPELIAGLFKIPKTWIRYREEIKLKIMKVKK
jgi:hypothetical protein